MSVQYAGNPFMSKRLIEVIQELRDYLGPEACGLTSVAFLEMACILLMQQLNTSRRRQPWLSHNAISCNWR